MEPIITSDVVVAYSQCPRKAYLLLFSPDKGEPHEYIQILEQPRRETQERCLNRLQQTHLEVGYCSLGRGHGLLLQGVPLVLFTRNTRRVSWRHCHGQTPRFCRPSLPARIGPVRGIVTVHSSHF